MFDFPVEHRRRLRTNNGLERLNREVKRRTRVATLFPNEDSLLRLATAVHQPLERSLQVRPAEGPPLRRELAVGRPPVRPDDPLKL